MKRRHQVASFWIAAHPLFLPLLSLPVNYGGPVHTNLNTSSTFFFVGLFRKAGFNPEYETNRLVRQLDYQQQASL